MLRRLLLLTFLGLASLGAYYPYHVPHLDFDALVGQYRSSGGATLFFPFGQLGPNLLFTQGTLGRFESNWVGDVGVGYRLQKGPNFGWGINGFFDYAYSDVSNLNWFGGGGGLELFGNFWEARINGYGTSQGDRVYRRSLTTTSQQSIINNRPVVTAELTDTRFLEVGRWGLDGEVGAGVCLGPGSAWAYIGYFRFAGKGVAILQGPRARAEYKLPVQMSWGTPEVWLGVTWQRDDVHKSQVAGTVHVQVPLYGLRLRRRCPNLSVFKRMGDSVRRQNGPIIEQVKQVRVAGRTTGLWFIREGAMGIGTQLDPTSLMNANANSLPGDFIFPLGPQPININAELAAAYSLKPSQTLVSFGNGTSVTLDINGAPFVVNDITGSGRGTLLQNNAALNGVVVNESNLVQGIGENGGLLGISGTGRTNVRLTDVRMTEMGGAFVTAPIAFTNMIGNLTIDQSVLEFTSPNGILLTKAAGPAVAHLVTNNTLTSTGGGSTGGIVSGLSNATVVSTTVTGNTLTNFATSGIALIHAGTGGQFTHLVTNNQVNTTGAGGPGIALTSDATLIGARVAFRLSGNTMNTAPGGGIGINFTTGVGAPTIIQGAITQANGINTGGTAAIPAMNLNNNLANAGDVATYLVDDTRFSGSANGSFGSIDIGNGTVNLTLTNSTDTAPQAGATTTVYVIDQNGAATSCLTMTDNNTTRAKTTTPITDRNIQLTRTAGIFNVFDLAGVPANNNGLTTNVVGTVTTVPNKCPTPVTP